MLHADGAPTLGDSATVFLAAHPERAIPATVSELPATADPASGLYNVELTLFHSELTILQGMYGRVRIRTRYSTEGPAIPLDALANTDGDHGEVFVLNGTMVRKRAVTLGPIDGDRVQVRAGLAPGEIVIAEGGAYLRDKSPVIVIAPTEHRN